ncbi:MAG TPA: hypothetical protein VM370_11275 [Candidatus Thermoplasmatota archaeon]|nr:hypothetical protein [Candidatus Thermoplasmatota archaeon]
MAMVSLLVLFSPPHRDPSSHDGGDVLILPGSDADSRYTAWDGSAGMLRVELVQGARLVVGDALHIRLPQGEGTLRLVSGALPEDVARFRWILYEGDVEVGSLDIRDEPGELTRSITPATQGLSLGFEAEGSSPGGHGMLRFSASFARAG